MTFRYFGPKIYYYIWAHKTSLTPSVLLRYTSQTRKVNCHVCVCYVMYLCVTSCMCVLGVSIFPLSTIFPLDFGNVPTVWYFCFPFNWNKAHQYVLLIIRTLINQLYASDGILVSSEKHLHARIVISFLKFVEQELLTLLGHLSSPLILVEFVLLDL